MAKLTPKRARFVDEYLVDLNAAAAARRAGYTHRRSEATGYFLLTNADIQAAIAIAQLERSARTGVTQDRVVKELARVAFADPRRVMTWGPDGVVLRDSAELTDDEAAIVAEVAQTVTEAGGSIKLKLNDKLSALDKLARHVGLFEMQIQAPGDGGVIVYIPDNGR